MKPVICIPFHDSKDKDRKKAYEKTKEYYSKLNVSMFYGDTHSKSFNRAELRNNAVKMIDCEYDSILFFDADIIVPYNQIQKAINLSQKLNELVIMYDTLYLLSEKSTQYYYTTNLILDFGTKIQNAPSGAFVVPRNIWEAVNGQDERFKEWGGEDRAFNFACAAVKHKRVVPRIKGLAFHLYHQRKNRTYQDLQKISLLQRYKKAVGANERFQVPDEFLEDTTEIFSILKEDNGPLSKKVNNYA